MKKININNIKCHLLFTSGFDRSANGSLKRFFLGMIKDGKTK